MFRATGITTYIEHFGLLENDQRMASHEYPRTTKLHDRTSDAVTVEKIVI
jgi:integrase/recombinase XerD